MRLLQSAVTLLTVCSSNMQACDFIQSPPFRHRIKKFWLICKHRCVRKVPDGIERWEVDFLVEKLQRVVICSATAMS